MPVRKIKKNYRNVTGVSSATKAVGDAEFESTLERDFLRLLEFSSEVQSFEVQPVTLNWQDDAGANRRYTPDVSVAFCAALGRAPWLCEVKYRADLRKNWAELRPKFRQAIRYARERGWRFKLMTEVEIRTPTLEAAKFLLPYRRREGSSDQLNRILGLLQVLQKTTPGDLIQQLAPDPTGQGEWLPLVWKLIAQFQIGVDFQRPLTMTSPIWSLK